MLFKKHGGSLRKDYHHLGMSTARFRRSSSISGTISVSICEKITIFWLGLGETILAKGVKSSNKSWSLNKI